MFENCISETCTILNKFPVNLPYDSSYTIQFDNIYHGDIVSFSVENGIDNYAPLSVLFFDEFGFTRFANRTTDWRSDILLGSHTPISYYPLQHITDFIIDTSMIFLTGYDKLNVVFFNDNLRYTNDICPYSIGLSFIGAGCLAELGLVAFIIIGFVIAYLLSYRARRFVDRWMLGCCRSCWQDYYLSQYQEQAHQLFRMRRQQFWSWSLDRHRAEKRFIHLRLDIPTSLSTITFGNDNNNNNSTIDLTHNYEDPNVFDPADIYSSNISSTNHDMMLQTTTTTTPYNYDVDSIYNTDLYDQSITRTTTTNGGAGGGGTIQPQQYSTTIASPVAHEYAYPAHITDTFPNNHHEYFHGSAFSTNHHDDFSHSSLQYTTTGILPLNDDLTSHETNASLHNHVLSSLRNFGHVTYSYWNVIIDSIEAGYHHIGRPTAGNGGLLGDNKVNGIGNGIDLSSTGIPTPLHLTTLPINDTFHIGQRFIPHTHEQPLPIFTTKVLSPPISHSKSSVFSSSSSSSGTSSSGSFLKRYLHTDFHNLVDNETNMFARDEMSLFTPLHVRYSLGDDMITSSRQASTLLPVLFTDPLYYNNISISSYSPILLSSLRQFQSNDPNQVQHLLRMMYGDAPGILPQEYFIRRSQHDPYGSSDLVTSSSQQYQHHDGLHHQQQQQQQSFSRMPAAFENVFDPRQQQQKLQQQQQSLERPPSSSMNSITGPITAPTTTTSSRYQGFASPEPDTPDDFEQYISSMMKTVNHTNYDHLTAPSSRHIPNWSTVFGTAPHPMGSTASSSEYTSLDDSSTPSQHHPIDDDDENGDKSSVSARAKTLVERGISSLQQRLVQVTTGRNKSQQHGYITVPPLEDKQNDDDDDAAATATASAASVNADDSVAAIHSQTNGGHTTLNNPSRSSPHAPSTTLQHHSDDTMISMDDTLTHGSHEHDNNNNNNNTHDDDHNNNNNNNNDDLDDDDNDNDEQSLLHMYVDDDLIDNDQRTLFQDDDNNIDSQFQRTQQKQQLFLKNQLRRQRRAYLKLQRDKYQQIQVNNTPSLDTRSLRHDTIIGDSPVIDRIITDSSSHSIPHVSPIPSSSRRLDTAATAAAAPFLSSNGLGSEGYIPPSQLSSLQTLHADDDDDLLNLNPHSKIGSDFQSQSPAYGEHHLGTASTTTNDATAAVHNNDDDDDESQLDQFLEYGMVIGNTTLKSRIHNNVLSYVSRSFPVYEPHVTQYYAQCGFQPPQQIVKNVHQPLGISQYLYTADLNIILQNAYEQLCGEDLAIHKYIDDSIQPGSTSPRLSSIALTSQHLSPSLSPSTSSTLSSTTSINPIDSIPSSTPRENSIFYRFIPSKLSYLFNVPLPQLSGFSNKYLETAWCCMCCAFEPYQRTRPPRVDLSHPFDWEFYDTYRRATFLTPSSTHYQHDDDNDHENNISTTTSRPHSIATGGSMTTTQTTTTTAAGSPNPSGAIDYHALADPFDHTDSHHHMSGDDYASLSHDETTPTATTPTSPFSFLSSTASHLIQAARASFISSTSPSSSQPTHTQHQSPDVTTYGQEPIGANAGVQDCDARHKARQAKKLAHLLQPTSAQLLAQKQLENTQQQPIHQQPGYSFQHNMAQQQSQQQQQQQPQRHFHDQDGSHASDDASVPQGQGVFQEPDENENPMASLPSGPIYGDQHRYWHAIMHHNRHHRGCCFIRSNASISTQWQFSDSGTHGTVFNANSNDSMSYGRALCYLFRGISCCAWLSPTSVSSCESAYITWRDALIKQVNGAYGRTLPESLLERGISPTGMFGGDGDDDDEKEQNDNNDDTIDASNTTSNDNTTTATSPTSTTTSPTTSASHLNDDIEESSGITSPSHHHDSTISTPSMTNSSITNSSSNSPSSSHLPPLPSPHFSTSTPPNPSSSSSSSSNPTPPVLLPVQFHIVVDSQIDLHAHIPLHYDENTPIRITRAINVRRTPNGNYVVIPPPHLIDIYHLPVIDSDKNEYQHGFMMYSNNNHYTVRNDTTLPAYIRLHDLKQHAILAHNHEEEMLSRFGGTFLKYQHIMFSDDDILKFDPRLYHINIITDYDQYFKNFVCTNFLRSPPIPIPPTTTTQDDNDNQHMNEYDNNNNHNNSTGFFPSTSNTSSHTSSLSSSTHSKQPSVMCIGNSDPFLHEYRQMYDERFDRLLRNCRTSSYTQLHTLRHDPLSILPHITPKPYSICVTQTSRPTLPHIATYDPDKYLIPPQQQTPAPLSSVLYNILPITKHGRLPQCSHKFAFCDYFFGRPRVDFNHWSRSRSIYLWTWNPPYDDEILHFRHRLLLFISVMMFNLSIFISFQTQVDDIAQWLVSWLTSAPIVGTYLSFLPFIFTANLLQTIFVACSRPFLSFTMFDCYRMQQSYQPRVRTLGYILYILCCTIAIVFFIGTLIAFSIVLYTHRCHVIFNHLVTYYLSMHVLTAFCVVGIPIPLYFHLVNAFGAIPTHFVDPYKGDMQQLAQLQQDALEEHQESIRRKQLLGRHEIHDQDNNNNTNEHSPSFHDEILSPLDPDIPSYNPTNIYPALSPNPTTTLNMNTDTNNTILNEDQVLEKVILHPSQGEDMESLPFIKRQYIQAGLTLADFHGKIVIREAQRR